MGRPKTTPSFRTANKKASAKDLTSNERKRKNKKIYNKSKFKSYLGNSKEGLCLVFILFLYGLVNNLDQLEIYQY